MDTSMNKKVAYDMMLKTLQEFPRDHAAVKAKLAATSSTASIQFL